VVLDYVLINSTNTNLIFKLNTIYYTKNYVALYSTTVLELGAVKKWIKHDGGPY